MELPGGSKDIQEQAHNGPRQDKVIRHVFAPELVYAPPFVAVPVGAVLCLLFVGYLIATLRLKVQLNNTPKSFSGRVHATLFVVS